MRASPLIVASCVLALCVTGALGQGELYTGSACTAHDGALGACTLVSDCPAAQQAIRRGQRPRICAFDGFTPVVCCPGAAPPTPAPTPAPTTSTSTARPPAPSPTPTPGGDGNGAKSRQKCAEYATHVWRLQRPAVALTPFEPKVNTSLCRVPELVGSQPFVIGGKNATLFEFPHMAAVGFGESDRKRWLCGGALISENYVLTAAHCIEDIPKPGRRGVGPARWVRLGDLNLYSDQDRAKVQEFSVVERIAHPRYVDGVKYFRGFETNEVMAFKFHYLSCIVAEINKCRKRQLAAQEKRTEASDNGKKDSVNEGDKSEETNESEKKEERKLEPVEIFAKQMLKSGRGENSNPEFQERFLRECVREFPFRESTVFRQMVASLAQHDSPSAYCVISATINGQRGFVDVKATCWTCGEEGAPKKCSKCKAVQYCDRECQRLHWFMHKKACARLSQSKEVNETKTQSNEKTSTESKTVDL